MLNFNNVPEDANPQNQEFSLIPVGTIARAVLLVQQGDVEVPEFGQGQWFKKSASTAAKWMNLEFTIIGGEFDRRKFWHSVFIDGDKIGPSGMPLAKEIGLRTLKSIVESAIFQCRLLLRLDSNQRLHSHLVQYLLGRNNNLAAEAIPRLLEHGSGEP